jgi:uncharacterized membrane protein
MDLSRLIQVALSHPIHVPLTHFPIGLAHVSALLAALSLFFAWRKNAEQTTFFSKALFYDLILLILSVFPAMATGMLENQTRYNGIAPNAPLKIMFGATLLLIAVVLAVWRWRNPNVMQSRAGLVVFVLCSVCAALTITLGFLGGIIVWGA